MESGYLQRSTILVKVRVEQESIGPTRGFQRWPDGGLMRSRCTFDRLEIIAETFPRESLILLPALVLLHRRISFSGDAVWICR